MRVQQSTLVEKPAGAVDHIPSGYDPQLYRIRHSAERFIGILLEHTAGALPVWLAPVQARIIPITDHHLVYSQQVAAQLRKASLRVEVDDTAKRMTAKIRDAQVQKVPYMLVIGNREMENGQVAVRLRTEEDLGAMAIDDFLALAQNAITEMRPM